MSGRKPLAMRELFALPVGSRFVVYYAKDDDPACVRIDHEERTIESTDGNIIVDSEGDDWTLDDGVPPDGDEDNIYDTSRGFAYFFHPRAT